jgi:hypothetical protein
MPVLFHCDVDMPFPKPGQDPYIVGQLRELVLRHPDTTIIWAHAGVGRVVHPIVDHVGMLERAIAGTRDNVYFDLSWDETAKYATEPSHIDAVAALINRHPIASSSVPTRSPPPINATISPSIASTSRCWRA